MMAYFTIICSGFMVGSAFATFYSALGVFSKLLYKIGVTKGYKALALTMCFGLVFGSIVSVFGISIAGYFWLSYLLMLFGGTFVGMYFAMLAEILKIIPLLSSLEFSRSFIFIAIFAVALGKLVGTLVYFFFPYFMQS
jgi:stage V sporulation protein AB